jgi:hypothetical protein
MGRGAGTGRWPLILSAVVAAAGGVPIVLWLSPALTLPDGTPMLDMHWRGYTHDEAMAYLTALSDEARTLYLSHERIADTLLPLGLFGLLVLIPRRVAGRRVAALALVLAASYLALDLMENAAIARLLRADPASIAPEAVAWASLLTQAKFVALGLSAALTAFTLVARAHLWFKHGP